jgi:hypothetical protein
VLRCNKRGYRRLKTPVAARSVYLQAAEIIGYNHLQKPAAGLVAFLSRRVLGRNAEK